MFFSCSAVEKKSSMLRRHSRVDRGREGKGNASFSGRQALEVIEKSMNKMMIFDF